MGIRQSQYWKRCEGKNCQSWWVHLLLVVHFLLVVLRKTELSVACGSIPLRWKDHSALGSKWAGDEGR